MFKEARIKLTLWYVAIIMTITCSLSYIVFYGVNSFTKRALESQRRRIERRLILPQELRGRRAPMLDEETLVEIKENTIFFLVTLNGLILVVVGGLSYFLAGRTLRPIEDMVNKQKRFISDASHELKTPLTSIKTNLEVALRDKKLNLVETKSILQETIGEIDMLNNLTNKLLIQSQAQNKHSVSKEQFFIGEVVEQVLRKLRSQSSNKKIEIRYLNNKVMVLGNRSDFYEMLFNLVENSIKYNRTGGTVHIEDSLSNGSVMLKIEDTGIGIEEKNIPRLFDPFYRVEESRANKGFGLGLSIVKEIVDRNDGNISIESQKNKGTTVTLKFPSANFQKGDIKS